MDFARDPSSRESPDEDRRAVAHVDGKIQLDTAGLDRQREVVVQTPATPCRAMARLGIETEDTLRFQARGGDPRHTR